MVEAEPAAGRDDERDGDREEGAEDRREDHGTGGARSGGCDRVQSQANAAKARSTRRSARSDPR